MNLTIRGLDLAKAGFPLHGIAERGQGILQGRLSRPRRRRVLANLPPGRVGLETCGGAHDGAHEIQKLGHAIKLINSQFVRFCGVNCFRARFGYRRGFLAGIWQESAEGKGHRIIGGNLKQVRYLCWDYLLARLAFMVTAVNILLP